MLISLFLPPAAGGTKKAKLITEGFILGGVDGKVVAGEQGWFFEPDSQLTAEQGQSPADMRMRILPSAQLEKIEQDLEGRFGAGYKLWGRVTKYADKNYVFVTYFLPLSKAKQEQPDRPEPAGEAQKPTTVINEPNDELAIPQEIIDRLTTKRAARTEPEPSPDTGKEDKFSGRTQGRGDFVIADRIGFITESSDGTFVFRPDAFGRGVEEVRIELLCCGQLEQAQRVQAAELERIRFKVAGIITSCKGRDYLLLQRAVRVYDYGNFGR